MPSWDGKYARKGKNLKQLYYLKTWLAARKIFFDTVAVRISIVEGLLLKHADTPQKGMSTRTVECLDA
jgi:hypothetical protein